MHRHRRTLQTKGIAVMARIADRSVLVTGGNRGMGRALVEEALRRGVSRVYVDTRGPLAHADGRVTPLTLDAMSVAPAQRAVESVKSLDVLIKQCRAWRGITGRSRVDLTVQLDSCRTLRSAPPRGPRLSPRFPSGPRRVRRPDQDGASLTDAQLVEALKRQRLPAR
jgi:hypothetical protein